MHLKKQKNSSLHYPLKFTYTFSLFHFDCVQVTHRIKTKCFIFSPLYKILQKFLIVECINAHYTEITIAIQVRYIHN